MLMSQMAEATAAAKQESEFSFADAVEDAQQMVMDFLGGGSDEQEQEQEQDQISAADDDGTEQQVFMQREA
jgi:hypothetical protein